MNVNKYLKEILLVTIFIMILGIYAFIIYDRFYSLDAQEDNLIKEATSIKTVQENNENKSVKKYVDVKGAVTNEGVFEISDETIINDVILMAGGFKDNAYTKNINLSKKLEDETVIYVYTKYEYSQIDKPKVEVVVEECNCPEIDISSCTNAGASVITSDEKKQPTIVEEKDEIISETTEERANDLININTASKTELMTLNGIGEAKAQKIIDYRNEKGNFKTIEDITSVSGISDAIFENIKTFITV